MVIKIGSRLALLGIILVVMNWIYTRFFFEKDLETFAPDLRKVRVVPQNTNILYIGESSNYTYREDDLDKRSISDLMNDYFPNLHVSDVTKPASHSGIYKVLLAQLPTDSQISTVIVTLNLRSFNAQWIYSDLETQLQKTTVLLRPFPPLVNRFMLSFKGYDIKSDDERIQQFIKKWERDEFHFPYRFPFKNVKEWDNWMAVNGIKDENGVIDFDRTALACHYIKAYGFQIDTLENPRIKDFNDIINLAKKRSWHLVFNLMAENTEKARELVGDDLLFLMEQNRDLLNSYFSRRGVVIVDNLEAVADQEFIDRNWTTEHYAEHGRKIIAANLAKAILQYYPNEYSAVGISYDYETYFFNDCDNGETWGPDQSISSDRAFSGKYSSKTGNGLKYSSALVYPIRRIPDSLKREVRIHAMIYQESAIHDDVRMVIQAEGESVDDFWRGFEINIPEEESRKWIPYEIIFTLPKEIYNANEIKIYLYNPSLTTIYLDDMEVEFLE
ncbi:MAG TPA: hypothetical protein P5514_07190 [Bacteroidales bacterium]|nr:hypothetical protein [Bacteroidales bacterium]HRX96713.1 hypothetical protein [Bacteroidales bacterium]